MPNGHQLFDGAMGPLLQDHGLEGGAAGELWNVGNPDAVVDAHRESAEAGATILMINTRLPQVVGDHFECDAGPDVLAAHAVRLRALAAEV